MLSAVVRHKQPTRGNYDVTEAIFETDNFYKTNTLYSLMGILCNHNINEIKNEVCEKGDGVFLYVC